MLLLDLKLKLVIENLCGTYKKFADSLEEYPLLGVTFPTHYGYIDGYIGEDTHDLDVFIGSGDLYGVLKMKRDDVEGGLETKILLFVTSKEYEQIKIAYQPVLEKITTLTEKELVELLPNFLISKG